MNNNKYLYFRKDYMYGEARLSYAYKIIFMCTFSTYFLEKQNCTTVSAIFTITKTVGAQAHNTSFNVLCILSSFPIRKNTYQLFVPNQLCIPELRIKYRVVKNYMIYYTLFSKIVCINFQFTSPFLLIYRYKITSFNISIFDLNKLDLHF